MTTLTSRSLNARAPIRGLLLVCGVCALGIVCGRIAISHYGVAALAVLVAIPLLVAVLPRPFVACTLLLVLLASVPFYTWLPRANVPGHPPINIGDILLWATVGATLWRSPWRVWPPAARRFGLVLGLLLAVALVPAIGLGLHGHDAGRQAITGYKDLLFITLGLTVALELRGKLWWPTVNAAIGLAAIVAVLSILGAASGRIDNLLTSFDANAVTAVTGTVGSTSRIRLPGLFFVYAMTIPTLVIVLLVKDSWRVLRLASLLLMIVAVAVSLNRNMYLGGAAGLLVTLLLGGAQFRHRFLLIAVTAAAILAIIVETAVAPAVTAEVGARAQSALTTQVLQSDSLQVRQDEFSHALTSISQHPWLGVGWYENYGDLDGDTPRLYVEDWYLHLATDMGIPVTIAFLLVPAMLVLYGVRRAWAATDPLDRALVGAGVGALTALLLSCLVGTYLQDPNSMTAFGFTCGFVLAAGLRVRPAASDARSGEAGERRRGGGAAACA